MAVKEIQNLKKHTEKPGILGMAVSATIRVRKI